MTRNRTTWVLGAALALLLAAGTLAAFQGTAGPEAESKGQPRARMGGPGGAAWAEQMGLTEAQRQQMRALRVEAQKAGIRSRADLQLKRMELEELLEADEPNQAAIDKAVRELNDLRAAAFKRRIEQRLAFHRLLTPEQRSQLRTLREQRGHHFRRHMRQRWMDGPGGERWQRRGPGLRREGGFGPGSGGGPDFDPDIEPEPPF